MIVDRDHLRTMGLHMKTLFFALALIALMVPIAGAQVGIQQQLLVIQNDGTNGGLFKVAVQVKGTNLTTANTLNGTTVDVLYGSDQLSFPTLPVDIIAATSWNGGLSGSAYSLNTSNPGSGFVRVLVAGINVNANGNGTPAGFDVGPGYLTLVTLTFTITNRTKGDSLTIAAGSNDFYLFDSHNNVNLGGGFVRVGGGNLTRTGITGVTDVAERSLPAAYFLDQNYPNPFNPSTAIAFALPRETRVTLEVYNLLGQRVALLVDDVRPAGYYSQRFDGSSFGSGIYFYRLNAGEVSFLKKMLLVK